MVGLLEKRHWLPPAFILLMLASAVAWLAVRSAEHVSLSNGNGGRDQLSSLEVSTSRAAMIESGSPQSAALGAEVSEISQEMVADAPADLAEM